MTDVARYPIHVHINVEVNPWPDGAVTEDEITMHHQQEMRVKRVQELVEMRLTEALNGPLGYALRDALHSIDYSELTFNVTPPYEEPEQNDDDW